MVFDLEEPFKSLYRKSYLREDKFGRKRVDLFNSEKDRTTIALARDFGVNKATIASALYKEDY